MSGMAFGPNLSDPAKRFIYQISVTDSCWEWTGTMHANGYGLFDVKIDGVWVKKWAHRYGYELLVGPIQPGLTLDHLCMNTACVRPDHLDPCPIGENSRRSPRTLSGANSRKTHYPKGHPYSGENLFYDQGKRKCRECVRAKNRRNDARRRAAKKSTALQ